MRLAELPVGTGILFDVSIQKQELEFPSEVVEVHDNFILTKPVMSKGKVVGLGGEGVSVSLTYSRNDKAPIVWKGVGCSVVKTKGRVLYKVIASGAGFEVNRREAFRLFVGLEGIARVGTNRRAMDVILKDLSDTGFAFVVDHEIEDATGLSVRLVFKDFDRNYDLTGFIVRLVKVEEEKYVYGCRMTMRNQLINHYISMKQRQMLANHSGANIRNRDNYGLLNALKEKEEPVVNESDLDTKYISDVDKSERRKIFDGRNPGKII